MDEVFLGGVLPANARPRISVPFASQETLKKEYEYIARFLDACQGPGLEVLRVLSKEKEDVNAASFRALRCLLTPRARQHVLELLPKERFKFKELEAACATAEKAQWVEFHWTSENTYIEASRRMSCAVVCASSCVFPPLQ